MIVRYHRKQDSRSKEQHYDSQYEYRLDFGCIMNFEKSQFDKYVKVVMSLSNTTK
jgi:hypothetical protein